MSISSSSQTAAAFLSGRGLAWANSSLVAAARVRITSTSLPPHHVDLLRVFVPGLHSQASFISTNSRHNNRANLNALARRRQLRFHSTETQNPTANDPNRPPLPATLPKSNQNNSQSSYQGQQVGKPPSPPTTSATRSTASPKVAPTATATATGTATPKSLSSQSNLPVEKEAKDVEPQTPKLPLHTRVWAKVKEEAAHYWHGSKLLAKEVKISSRLVRRLMLGYSLTRRERRQLKRTMADLLRLIPFIPFIIIPAGELLLPVAIKIFPNMLPSTFESKFAVEEKRRGLIKVRLEMAKFLQETIREGGLQATDKVKTSEEFAEFFRKVRSTGESPDEKDTLKVAKLFEDDLTLDNLSRPQLVSVCRYMQINAFGTDNYLRYQIRHTLNRIRKDDIAIKTEGVESMSLPELVSACQNRGIRTSDLSEERLREELAQWIHLHIKERISGILLILSKAFNYVGAEAHDDANSHIKSLELTLSSLPDNLLSEAELQVNQEGATNKQRLEVLEQQEELIEDEAEQEQEEAAAREADKERRNAEKARLAENESHSHKNRHSPLAEQDARMTNEQLLELGEALSLLSAKSSVLREREELAALIKEVNAAETPQLDAEPDSETRVEVHVDLEPQSPSPSQPQPKPQPQLQPQPQLEQSCSESSESSTSTHSGLSKRIKSMLGKIDAQLEEYDRDVGTRMHIIKASPSGKISVHDLEQALRLIKHRPNDEMVEKLVDKLDVDHDGLVPLQDVLELARAESGLGILRDDTVNIKQQGKEIRGRAVTKPKRSDILEE